MLVAFILIIVFIILGGICGAKTGEEAGMFIPMFLFWGIASALCQVFF